MLSSQRGGPCQLSHCPPAPTPPFTHSVHRVKVSQVRHSENHIVLPAGSPLRLPTRRQRQTQRLRQEEELARWCLLPPALVHFTQQDLFTLAVAEPSCAASESGLQFFQHLQNHPPCTPQKHHHQPPSIHSSRSSQVCVSAPWGPSSKFLRFNNTISSLSPASPRAAGCFLQLPLL